MALQSQVPRPDLLRNPTSRRSRRRKSRARLLVGLVLVVVVAVAVWQSIKWWSANGGAEPTKLAAAETAEPNEGLSGTMQAQPLTLSNPGPRSTPHGPPRGSAQAQPPGDASATAPSQAQPPQPALRQAEPIDTQEQPGGAQQAGDQQRSSAGVRGLLAQASELTAQGKLVDARALLNRALHSAQTGSADRERIRAALTDINHKLVFEPVLMQNDPFMRSYVIESGDSLWKLARQSGVYVDENFLMRINGIGSGTTLRLGQTIKIPTRPFHAVVHKPAYRMDLYMGDAGRRDEWMYVRSYPVGLGEYDSTPAGSWVVAENRKTTNPDWRNPRTGEYFGRDDLKNPIGEHWIALTGTDANTHIRSGYGIHGTIEPDSIGRSMSMGCIRMLPADVEVVYEMLAEVDSTVWIVEE